MHSTVHAWLGTMTTDNIYHDDARLFGWLVGWWDEIDQNCLGFGAGPGPGCACRVNVEVEEVIKLRSSMTPGSSGGVGC